VSTLVTTKGSYQPRSVCRRLVSCDSGAGADIDYGISRSGGTRGMIPSAEIAVVSVRVNVGLGRQGHGFKSLQACLAQVFADTLQGLSEWRNCGRGRTEPADL
jgi:hypothetical protein